MADDCKHDNKNGGICTDCGLCDIDCELQDTVGTHSNWTVAGKYTVEDPEKRNDMAIKKILVPLNLMKYQYAVKETVKSTCFKYKINDEDRVIVSIYHILKQDGFPISIIDLLKYSRMSKYRMLKIHRDTFGFLENSMHYLLGVYQRVLGFLISTGQPVCGTFEEFSSLCDRYRSSEARSLCLAYLIEQSGIRPMVLSGEDAMIVGQVRAIRRKLRRDKPLLR